MDELRNYIFVNIISADNDEFGLSEEDKQEIIARHKLGTDPSDLKHPLNADGDLMDWEYILEPIKDEKIRKSLIDFFNDEYTVKDERA